MYMNSLNLTFGVTICWCSAIFSKKRDDFASSLQNKQWSKDLVGYFMDAVNTACGALPDWDFIWEQKMAIWQMSDLICICQRMKLDQTLQPWVQGLETITTRTSGQTGTGLLLLTQLFRQLQLFFLQTIQRCYTKADYSSALRFYCCSHTCSDM